VLAFYRRSIISWVRDEDFENPTNWHRRTPMLELLVTADRHAHPSCE